jgi:hypothetical protein
VSLLFRRRKAIIDPDRKWAENDADRWVLALKAPYLEQAFALLDSEPVWFEKIDGGSPPDAADNCRQTLEADWGITDKESTIKEVRALLDVGHRADYEAHRAVMVENRLFGKSEDRLRAAARFRVENDPEIKAENRYKAADYLTSVYLFISQAEPTLGEGGIGGWDFVRVGKTFSHWHWGAV